MATLLDVANKLADPKFKAACERIIAHPRAIPEAKDTARAFLKLVEMEMRRRERFPQRKLKSE